MPTKKAGSRSTACSRTWPERDEAVSTIRFAQPSRDAQPTSSIFFPTDIFPFTDQPETDPVTGEKGGLLDRATADKVVPKIFFSNTSYEYWGRAASLIHTTADGKQDAPISNDVRIYHFTGLQHFSGPFPPAKGEGDLMDRNRSRRCRSDISGASMIANMDAWVRNGTAPPESSYPKIADGHWSRSRTTNSRDSQVNKPKEANRAYRLNFGPEWSRRNHHHAASSSGRTLSGAGAASRS